VSSLLILALIALPITGLAAASVFVDSMMGTPAEKADVELGRTAAWVRPGGVPGSGLWQMPSEPYWNGYAVNEDGGWTEPTGEVPADPLSALPPGTETIAVSADRVRLDTAAGVAVVSAWAGPAWDARLSGRFDVVGGRAPQNDREVMVTPATLQRTGAVVGGTITVADSEYTVVGTIDVASLPDAESAVVFSDAGRFGDTTWYLPELSFDWAGVQELNEKGMIAYSREVVLDPPSFIPDGYDGMSDPAMRDFYSRLALVATLAAGAVAAGYMVVMLAGAAFAVSARRQQRALAIAASVGADARDLRRVVRLQGTVLGVLGGVVGVAAGVGVAAVVQAVVDNGSATMFWGFHVPWPILAGILVFAVIVGTVSALMPARGVARTDAISALRGARRPQKVTAARPVWGSLMLIAGVAITIVSGLAAAAVAVSTDIPYDSPLRWLPVVGIIGGPILAQLGIILSGRWLLWLCSLALSKLGIAARMASRDAVANGARTVPAFAAIGATVFVGVFALAMGTMSTGQTARSWSYSAPVGTAIGTVYAGGPELLTAEAAQAAVAATEEVYTTVGAATTAVVSRQQPLWVESESDIPEDLARAVVVTPERSLLDPESSQGYSWRSELADPSNNLSVIALDDLATVTGVELTEAQRAAYREGAVLVTDGSLVTDRTVEIASWTERQWQFGDAPSNIWQPWPDQDLAEPQWSRTLDAIVVRAPLQGVQAAISPETAAELGVSTVPLAVFGAFAEPPTTEQRDRLQSLGEGLSADAYGVSVWIETGPPSADAWLVPLLAGVAVLVLGASSVALGLARFERRPDDATLAAVGGTNALRRRIGFWQGLVIAGFGTFAGAAAGILPPIGFMLQSQTGGQVLQLADVPWGLLVALAVGLPLVIAVVNWIVPPRRPELTRRSAIA
jgi:MFS family permease